MNEHRGETVQLEYEAKTDTYIATFDNKDIRPSLAVVYAMAGVCDTDPSNLDSLFDIVRPEGIDMLCGDNVGISQAGDPTVTFLYHNHSVSVHNDGRIEISPVDE